MPDGKSVVTAFNDAINARDVEVLGALMTADHRFIDSEGHTVDGKEACLEAWRGFFAAFPDYRNVFERLDTRGDGAVEIEGYSFCSEPLLDGPARWRAVVRDGLIAEWQVFDASM
jgi:ketosteroid isomerase-like protein